MRAISVLSFAFFVLSYSGVSLAQVAQVGQPIAEVVLEEEGRVVSDPSVVKLIQTRVGEPLAPQAWRETIAHLMSLNRFEDIRIFGEPVAGGVRLKYVLVPRHPIDKIEFRGEPGAPVDELRRIVTDRFGNEPNAARSEEMAQLLRTEYRRRGYPTAKVTPRVEVTHEPDRATLIMDVESGMHVRIIDVRITQVDAEERSTISEPPEVTRGQFYDEQEITRELQAWETRTRARGYYEARAGHNDIVSNDGAIVLVNLELGPLVLLNFIGDPLPESERDRLVPVRAEASVDEDLLEDSRRAIERYLYERGHRDAEAPYTREEAPGRLVITFRITRGPRYLVRRINVTGNKSIPTADLLSLLRLKEGEPFVRARLAIGVGAIEGAYRARGYTQAQVKPADSVIVPESRTDPDRPVELTLAIVEGPRTEVRSVTFEGNKAVSVDDLRTVIELAPGRPFSAADVVADRDRVEQAYRDRGYDSTVVNARPTFAENNTRADVRFTISEGPQILVDHVIITGNRRISDQTIERELLLKSGAPLGDTAVNQSRANLQALELFRTVQISAVEHSGELKRDVVVQVEESAPTTIDIGGGLEGGYFLRPTGEGGQAEERFELAPRGAFQIGRRNLWGKNRSVTLFTRVSLRSRDSQVTDPSNPSQPFEGSYGFHEYRVVGTYREPRILRTSAEVQLTGIFEQAIRSSFNFSRREMRAQAAMRLSRIYTVSGLYSFQRTKLFDIRASENEEAWQIDKLFPQVRLSKFEGTVLRDSRDANEALDPSHGTLLIATGDIAARAIGSEVGFVKTYLQGFMYRQLPVPRRTVLALGARVGLAHGFGRELNGEFVNGLPASERFFAGGDTTVRGFALDRLGNERTISSTGFPTGGNSLIVLNSELRVNLFGAFQGVGFLDGGNVFPLASDLDFTDLRPAAGFGVVFKAQRFGLVRADLGFNLDPQEFVPGVPERKWVLHILLGQAF